MHGFNRLRLYDSFVASVAISANPTNGHCEESLGSYEPPTTRMHSLQLDPPYWYDEPVLERLPAQTANRIAEPLPHSSKLIQSKADPRLGCQLASPDCFRSSS